MDPAIDDGPPTQGEGVESLERLVRRLPARPASDRRSPVADVPKPSDSELRGDDEGNPPRYVQ